LQGSPLAPSPRLGRLHDTCVEPTHHGVGVLPVPGLPVRHRARDRTRRWGHCCHLLCRLRQLATLSRDARPAWEGSSRACRVMLPTAHPRSTPLQDGVRFLPRPCPAPPWPCRAARFPSRERYGLPTVHTSTTGCGRLCLFAGGATSAGRATGTLPLAPYLVVQASQPLWLVGSHDVYRQCTSVSHGRPPALPTAVGLAVMRVLSRVPHPLTVRLLCPTSFRPSGGPGRLSW
jgi:hypothetical protein